MLFRCEGLEYQDALAQISKAKKIQKYMEIGVQAGINLSKIEAKHAIGIDPAFSLCCDPTAGKQSLCLYRMTSDEFFASHHVDGLDLSFLDGMHQVEYLLRDFMNAESSSTNDGMILMHDCLPFEAYMVSREDNGAAWTGDVWKIVPILRRFRPDLKILLLDAAPTGLVCVMSLDKSSTVLRDAYEQIVATAAGSPNDFAALDDFYTNQTISSTADFISSIG